MVLQQNVLFNCSVRENIALADPGMALERVIGAAMQFHVHPREARSGSKTHQAWTGGSRPLTARDTVLPTLHFR